MQLPCNYNIKTVPIYQRSEDCERLRNRKGAELYIKVEGVHGPPGCVTVQLSTLMFRPLYSKTSILVDKTVRGRPHIRGLVRFGFDRHVEPTTYKLTQSDLRENTKKQAIHSTRPMSFV